MAPSQGGFDFGWEAGPAGGSLVDLLQYVTFIRFPVETSEGFRGSDPIGQYQHGQISSPRKFHPAKSINVEMGIKGRNPTTDIIDHVDGEAGHIYENFSSLKQIMASTQGKLVRLRRTAPDHGIEYLDLWQTDVARPSQNRQAYIWPMMAPRPFWTGTADNGNAPPTLTVAGDAPIDDMVIDFTGTATDPRLTHDDTGDYVEYDGVLPAGGVRIDVGAGTCVRITGGADEAANLRVLNPWWMELDPGANATTLSEASGTAVCSVSWNTKWR